MPYTLVKGEFHLYYKISRHVESPPDGDSRWFKPNDPAMLSNIGGRNPIGENRDTTVIYGGAGGSRVRIDSDWVNPSGFTVTGMGPFDWDNHGIYIDYELNTSIENVNVTENINMKIKSIPTILPVGHTMTRKEV